jgi:hypothetical protein
MKGENLSKFSKISECIGYISEIRNKNASCRVPYIALLVLPMLLLSGLTLTASTDSKQIINSVHAIFDTMSEEDDITENRMIIPLQDGYFRQQFHEDLISKSNLAYDSQERVSSIATCDKLSVSSVTASGNDGNLPTNAIDDNLNTRWSNNGVGSWIQLDLGSKKSICNVDIAWYRGNLRQSNFIISVSDDGNTFTKKFTGKSSGSTTSLEKYSLPTGTEGRYVRITVNGNTENNWASITEVATYGAKSVTCNTLTPTAVSASKFVKPHVPTDAIDKDFDTKWASKGVGSWIQLDFGSTKNVCHVYISWFMGDARQFKFDISVSVSNDGTSFTKVLSGTSSGTTSGYEKFILPTGTEARYLRITGNGNDVTDYNNIQEIAVMGSAGVSTSPPSSGGDAGTNDKFGIVKLYNSKVNGEQWYLGDPITGGIKVTKPSYYYETTSTQVRLRVPPPSSGYHPDQISTLDQNQMASKGYMQSPYDWKNVEITGRFKVVSYTDSTTNGAAHIALSGRGGTHTSSAPCEGTSYWGNLYVTGRSKFDKELMHTGGYATNNPQKTSAVGPLQGKWFDLKYVIYTLPSGNVKVEQYYQEYVDGKSSGWKKIFEHTDTGSWGGGTNNCGGGSYEMIKWGGPLVFFRWDNIDKMHFYNLSVREIVPP